MGCGLWVGGEGDEDKMRHQTDRVLRLTGKSSNDGEENKTLVTKSHDCDEKSAHKPIGQGAESFEFWLVRWEVWLGLGQERRASRAVGDN